MQGVSTSGDTPLETHSRGWHLGHWRGQGREDAPAVVFVARFAVTVATWNSKAERFEAQYFVVLAFSLSPCLPGSGDLGLSGPRVTGRRL